MELWSGPTDSPQVNRIVATLVHDDGTFRSGYETFANRGADIFDRRLYLVATHRNENRFAPLDTFATYPRDGTMDKKKYSVAELVVRF